MIKLETVVIKTKGGDVAINKSDFDAKTMKLAAAKKAPVKKKVAAKKA